MRVSLARAVYSRADVYILDDPLAAVDSHVSKHIFTNVLGPKGILQSRARILVTNAVQYLNNVDNIVMLCDGEIIEQSSFVQAMEKQREIFEFIHRHFEDAQSSSENSSMLSDIEYAENGLGKIDCRNSSQQLLGRTDTDATNGAAVQSGDTTLSGEDRQTEDVGRIISAESRRKGKVAWSTYSTYVNASGKGNVTMLYIGFLLAVIGDVCANMWLKYWSSSSTDTSKSNLTSTHSPFYYLYIYGGIGLFGAAISLLKALVLWTRCSIRASTVVHQNMLTGVIRSPMSFFDTTPIGRILNRFSSDVESCDQELSSEISNLMDSLAQILSALAIIAITIPHLLVITPLLAYASRYYQKLYIKSSRELRRLYSTTRSPIFAQFHESAAGITTIRAYSQQSRFITENEYRIGQNIRVDNASLLLDQWLAMRLETIGNFLKLGAAVNAIATMHRSGTGDGSLIGVVISSTFVISGATNWLMRTISDIEVCMTHLERAAEYAALPAEAANIIEDCRPKEVWPEKGMVEFRNYSTRYRNGLDLALKDMTFRVMPRQKVGIVGRTGAGKSSLTLALFRIIEAAGGQILLDGEDISKYGLFDVRSKLSIIPQDAVLFAGTVRENLDPFNNYSDQEIWRVLEQANLAEYIRNKHKGLEFMVAQNGSNFSAGQRQLICLARALLKHAKILVLDEATAAIDNTTDVIIQQTIKREFKDCTVLTIAHRLNTVIDSDMVLVVDEGRLAEYDTPQNLLANKQSIFTKLVEEAQNSNA
ncbi:P-loop containing nucleoside triphosphate hydrolase protein [Coemansia reversa NRRL 1564]|uniref:P-loop containing nucleoside triphosphate hydrolase protein n=1 Tax=Coemansia reversa (strain ATCC 12441 / NRRL 1564) TaxID=763665 RepID=A0A2G5B6Y0_COERN|nr:P-loop containing nucleoside triphosphate hydrolase protein [Coemansia reversa NRRL 1564]|eukprot:PIA14732.1 P-loop containing nucleoside triphosphate hydrolase protein [Coemansia reversa NRRL 1564]